MPNKTTKFLADDRQDYIDTYMYVPVDKSVKLKQLPARLNGEPVNSVHTTDFRLLEAASKTSYTKKADKIQNYSFALRTSDKKFLPLEFLRIFAVRFF